MNCLRRRVAGHCFLQPRRAYAVPGDVIEGTLRKSPLQIQPFELDEQLVVPTAYIALSMKTMFKWKSMQGFNRKKLSEHGIALHNFSMSALEVIGKSGNVDEKYSLSAMELRKNNVLFELCGVKFEKKDALETDKALQIPT